MKNLLSLILCLLLLCGVILLPSCTAERTDGGDLPSHYDDLPPDWTPAAPLPDDAVIYNDETGIPDTALYIAVLRAIEGAKMAGVSERALHFERTGEGTFTAGEAAAITFLAIRPRGTSTDLTRYEDGPFPTLGLGWYPPRNFRGIEHLRNLEETHLILGMDFERPGWLGERLYCGLDSLNELRRLEHLPHLRTFIGEGDIFSRADDDGHQERLENLMPFRNLTQLTTLRIRAASITSLDGIQNLTNLEHFWVLGAPSLDTSAYDMP